MEYLAHRENRRASSEGPFRHGCVFFFWTFFTVDKDKHNLLHLSILKFDYYRKIEFFLNKSYNLN